MKKTTFAALLSSTEEALAHARGKRQLRTTTLPGAPQLMGADEVRALRARLNASQAVFAHFLNVSTKLVQAWESERRRPDGAALRLLTLGATNPDVVFPGLTTHAPTEHPARKPTTAPPRPTSARKVSAKPRQRSTRSADGK